MPHFILDCSETVLLELSEEQILKQVHEVAHSTGLFDEGDIKIRVHPFKSYLVGNKKADLSKRVVQKLASMFPKISRIAVNVYDFEKATYCNRDML